MDGNKKLTIELVNETFEIKLLHDFQLTKVESAIKREGFSAKFCKYFVESCRKRNNLIGKN